VPLAVLTIAVGTISPQRWVSSNSSLLFRSSKRLAPVLIKEITRRVNLTNTWQAVYTAGVVLPRPVGRCRYWHRSLNPKKLIEVRRLMYLRVCCALCICYSQSTAV
jgi:hypothetical protein